MGGRSDTTSDHADTSWWIESAYTGLGDWAVRTFQNEQGFVALLAQAREGLAIDIAQESVPDLVEALGREGSPFLCLLVVSGQARAWRRGVPEPIWIHEGSQEHLVWNRLNRDALDVQEVLWSLAVGDCVVVVQEAYGAVAGLSGSDLGIYVERWSRTGADASQLRDAVAKTGKRLANDRHSGDPLGIVWALRVRERVSMTVWTGPPEDASQDREALDLLMAEPGFRVICGDTTAQIAARFLGESLEWDRTSLRVRTDVPPFSRLAGIDLVTEGIVTMRRAGEWIRGAETARDLPRHIDGATRLAHLLLSADVIRFVGGRAVNPVQVLRGDERAPVRVSVVLGLASLLRSRGKTVRLDWV